MPNKLREQIRSLMDEYVSESKDHAYPKMLALFTQVLEELKMEEKIYLEPYDIADDDLRFTTVQNVCAYHAACLID